MSLLSELKTVADTCAIPVETGVFSGVPPDLYLVITPMVDTFALHADDSPGYDTQEARLSLFVKGSYTAIKDTLVRALLGADFCITDRRYIAHEDDTGFHHYAIDVAKLYQLKITNGAAARAARMRYLAWWCANCHRRLAGEMEE